MQSVTLLAVSKTFGADGGARGARRRAARFGENYVQEALDKIAALADLRPRIEWHLIGPLQSNKTRVVAERLRLGALGRPAEDRRAAGGAAAGRAGAAAGLPAGQHQRRGEQERPARRPSVGAVARAVAALPRLRLRGLMAPQPAHYAHPLTPPGLVSRGRPVESVTLLAVSKTLRRRGGARGARRRASVASARTYVQEGVEKIAALRTCVPPLEWHLIGPLQSNKTRVAAEHFDWVHSVDRLKIAERLSEQRPAASAAAAGVPAGQHQRRGDEERRGAADASALADAVAGCRGCACAA